MTDQYSQKTTSVTIRLDNDQMRRLEAHGAKFNMNRSDVVRHCFMIGLEEAESASKIVSSPILGPLLQIISDLGPGVVGEEMRSVRQQLREYAQRDESQQSLPFNNDSEDDGGLNPNLA